jgi:uncharacterized membrane protein YphA (DoxX/SURF4 family)
MNQLLCETFDVLAKEAQTEQRAAVGFGILLIAGFSVLSGHLLLSFAIGMVTGLGIKSPFDYSFFSVAAAAFLLAFRGPDRFTLDELLNRSRN